jgi:cell division GTPase FtsZ
MKLIAIGLGQAGCRIADEFARLGKKARSQRRLDIVPGVFAVNTDAADLSGLHHINADYQHRILIGGRKTSGHGVGKINELGAEIAKTDGDKVIDAIRSVRQLFEADAFFLIASSGGGTGSGSIPVIAKAIKERYRDIPVYTLIVLPFEHEEETEDRTIYNSATCLKSVNEVADAIFLVDNQRYVKKDSSLRNNLSKINSLIAEPFYNVLCAGEEKKAKYIGAKTLDSGDIMATLTGWTVIGYGKSPVKLIRLPFERTRHFVKKSNEIYKGIQAMDEAFGELSMKCNPADSGRALYLLAAPHGEMNMELVKDLGDYMRDLAPQAIIRSGDYPRERGLLDVTVVLSELRNVEKIRDYFERSTLIIPEMKKRQQETASKLKDIDEAAKDIPSLLS